MKMLNSFSISIVLSARVVAATLAFACCDGANSAEATQDQSSPSRSFGTMTPEQVANALKTRPASISVYDANPKDVYRKYHVPSAIWVRYDAVTAGDLPVDKDRLLVFYCANPQCLASHEAAKSAIKLGYKNVFIMPAGIFGWVEAKMDVATGNSPS